MTIDDIDDILSRWHHWARNQHTHVAIKQHPMWKSTKSPRTWDSLGDVIDVAVEDSTMEAVDHAISNMVDTYRTALQIAAKNLYTGAEVWESARLPTNPRERRFLVHSAKAELISKLIGAGVIQKD